MTTQPSTIIDNNANAPGRGRATIRPTDLIRQASATKGSEESALKVLITAAKSPTARIIIDGLAGRHDLVLTDIGSGSGIVACALGHDESTDTLVNGIDAIVHLGYQVLEGDAAELIDYHTRRTYNLLLAASNAGVRRVIHVSTLRLMDRYEENLTVTEKWRSLPKADDPQILACHLGEIVCKEFARDRLIQTVNLRLGFPVFDGGGEAAAASGETAAVDTEAIVDAVAAALECDAGPWQDVHIQSPVPNQRFRLHAAEKLLGLEIGRNAGGRQ